MVGDAWPQLLPPWPPLPQERVALWDHWLGASQVLLGL